METRNLIIICSVGLITFLVGFGIAFSMNTADTELVVNNTNITVNNTNNTTLNNPQTNNAPSQQKIEEKNNEGRDGKGSVRAKIQNGDDNYFEYADGTYEVYDKDMNFKEGGGLPQEYIQGHPRFDGYVDRGQFE